MSVGASVLVSRGIVRDGNAVLMRRSRRSVLWANGFDHFSELGRIDATRGGFVVTSSADCNVLVRATNHLNRSFIAKTHGEGRIVLTEHAHGAKLRDRFGTRDQV